MIETKAVRNKQQDNVRAAKLEFMLDLDILIKGTAVDPLVYELNCCLEDNNISQILNEYKAVAKKLIHQWCIIMVADRIIVPKTLRYAALDALHFGHTEKNKVCNDAAIVRWPKMRADIEQNSKIISANLNVRNNLNFKKLQTEKKRNRAAQNTG